MKMHGSNGLKKKSEFVHNNQWGNGTGLVVRTFSRVYKLDFEC